ncbi:Ldh family oxidoreductase [Sinorhizobium meliloti]|uniref:Ldh family oxidoreductase n=1 Tax=Rhizobium meliloti TaxID=382 RepID=UPI0012957638|nr:Ldh family oxidoreductase [Sinorhizobium meliloti]MDW9390580.1 Ldh family oxidoreductase [Sinorhizobium meliloti]MDW9435243.1 Ldh family oxidoreductase [Sinorhizobium meliloti]MDW9481021.1 Ldh family oxidoreductase [Sinorhizobium meliloti]MDW9587691.1 Ldh family oxidoreductase [Sinorhizobium meliloti]MDW9593307.1 Ldh family oxidoreductase [Sinorhizobium meliloti]
MRLPPARLRKLSVALLEKRGVPADSARLQANLLLEAELRGLPSHGLQRLPLLLSRLDKGLANPTTRGNGTWRRASFLSVDGERGLGPVVMMDAMRVTGRILKETGLAIAAIRNANHMGMLAYYAEAAARDGLIGIVMSTSEALVHPFGGTQALIGTNPVAIGIPAAGHPFVLDLATSIVSMGKINNHAMRGLAIPPGWAVDRDGRATTDPHAAQAGAIAPFGDAKGYGLGLAIELLVAALAGSNLAPDVNGTLDDIHPANKGDLLILIDPSAGAGSIPALAAYLDRLRLSRPLDPTQPVAIPGDGARARRAAAAKTGIELPQPLFDHLTALEAA